MKKIVVAGLIFLFCLNIYAEKVLTNYERFVLKNQPATIDWCESLDCSFQTADTISGALNWWRPNSFLSMKWDSLNLFDDDNPGSHKNLTKKYGKVFNRKNVPQMVSYNEGVDSALKDFCGSMGKCNLFKDADIIQGRKCEMASDSGCQKDSFCSEYGTGGVCVPRSVIYHDYIAENDNDDDYLIEKMNCSDQSCNSKEYYDITFSCSKVEDYFGARYCVRSYGGSCNAQAITPVMLPDEPLREVCLKGECFSKIEIENLVTFTGHPPFLENWRPKGFFCMAHGHASRDYLGYYSLMDGVSCRDINPVEVYVALNNTIPMEGINDPLKTGVAMNFDHWNIWYKHVYGFKTDIVKEISETELKRCIAGDETVDERCLTPCIKGEGDCVKGDETEIFMPARDIESVDFNNALAVLGFISGSGKRYYLMSSDIEYSVRDDENSAGTVTVFYILGVSIFNNIVLEGYWVGKSKYQQFGGSSNWISVDTIQWAKGHLKNSSYAGIHWEDVKILYEISAFKGNNCPQKKNVWVINNSEIVTAPCDENGVGGAACMIHTKNFVYKDGKGNYWWQPDHDLDGIGDACDNDTVWTSFQGVPLNREISKRDDYNSNNVVTYYDIFPNDMLSVSLKMNSTYSIANYTATTRFCWLTPDEYNENKWGTEGKCTTEAKSNSQGCIIDFGYSHGSDPKPTDDRGVAYWKESTLDKTPEHTVIKGKGSYTPVWNWRKDFADDSASPEIVSALSNAPLCAEYDIVSEECKDSSISRFYYSLSTGTRGENSAGVNYLVDAVNANGGNENVNPAYFRNQQRYARTERLSKDPVEISYYYYKRGKFNDIGQKHCLGAPCNFPIDGLLQEFIIGKFREIVTGPSVFERPGMEHFFKNDFGSDFLKSGAAITEWSMTEAGAPSVKTASRPQFLATVTKNIEGTNTGLSLMPQGSMQLMGYNPESTTGAFYQIVEMDINSNGDWRTTGIINNTPENFSPVASTFHNNSLYVVSIEDHAASEDRNIYVIVPIESGGNTCSWSGNIFVPERIGSLPDLSNITIHSFNDSLIAVGEGANGMEIHKLVEQSGDTWLENITGTSAPSMRDVYNVAVNDGTLYLAGGIEIGNNSIDFKTDMWKFTESDGWTLIRNDLNLFPVSFRIDFDGGDIILTDRIFKSDATAERVRFNADGSGDTPVVEIVTVEGVPVISIGNYCLNETDNIVKGGLEISGECMPFTHPWYRSFATGSTIYSVAGKGDRLYVGTNNSIKVYDISDPEAFVLKSTFSTGSRRVYDLEVADDDIMYAATSGGIYKLNTANPDTLTSLSFFATSYNYQYRIQLYNDKLYVGDDNGINIRNKDTFARLAYVNVGSVPDFAIANGEIALYRSSFWSSGLHIRDVETLNLKAYEYAECYTGELTTDHGAFYLSCDGYEYRFEGRPDTYFNYYPLDGDMREMQENHVYNGWTYIPDGSSVKLSTLNDVPSYCGNGVIEPGELCDGNSVACTTISSSYVSGTAYCNSTCDGYNEGNCSTDGW